MHIDRMCLQPNATQMFKGNTVSSPGGNLPSVNVCCPHKIGFQMPCRKKWREENNLDIELFAVLIFHDDISLPYARF